MHDPRFKRLLKEFFPEFLSLFFPDWAERFNFGKIEWLDKEIVTDALEGESRTVDLVAKLPTFEPVPSPDSQVATGWLALVHVEIEAADTVAPLRRRMFHYYEPLRHRHDLPVLPIGLYLRVGLKGIGWDVYEEHFWGHRLVRFEYPYVGLPALDAEQYVRQDNWLGVALAALMQMAKERRISLAAEALERLVHCPENSYRKTLLCECVSAYLPLDEEQRQQYEDMLRNHPDSGVQAMQLGFLDHIEQRGIQLGIQQGIEQGIEKGIQKGIQKGKLEGLRGLLREQLEVRFGPLSPSAIARLEASSSDQLKELGVALISASSLEQLGLGDEEAG